MRRIAVLLCLAITASAVPYLNLLLTEEWHAFKMEHGKEYSSDLEERYRVKIYAGNKLRIARHNQRYELGLESYKLALNKYADMLHYEFVHTMTGFNISVETLNALYRDSHERGATFIPPLEVSYPGQMDWRGKGAVTEVKDQGRCGSCWAFATTGTLEGQHYRKSGYLVSLSEQNLIDCSTAYNNHGCHGGFMFNAYRYIQDNNGIDTEKSYPYEGRDNEACRFKRENVGAADVGFVVIPQDDEEKLMQAVATVGPVAVAIDASKPGFQLYHSGVYYDGECSTTQLNHGVLVVGYGTDEQGGDYWLVKNSWGTSWGDNGYIKMARNRQNNCGVATVASYPLV